ncbi:MAG: hypothetical protein AWU54_429 [Candidatus Frackibacter sp. T328-2]|jgi:hypothetical protein|nr:MAG: hypothetical protein AWU54_429 [Candidatus Frackibacter sp. T328-2]
MSVRNKNRGGKRNAHRNGRSKRKESRDNRERI